MPPQKHEHSAQRSNPKVLFWGTYDKSKPRVRILIDGLRQNNIPIKECHATIWEKVRDKSQISGAWRKSKLLLKLLTSYPMLLIKVLRAEKPDILLIAYPGILDMAVIYLFAKAKGIPVIWDVFITLYNTVVEDRQLINRNTLLAKLLFQIEKFLLNLPHTVVTDTATHGLYINRTFQIKRPKIANVIVGVEEQFFPPLQRKIPSKPARILFYGQFIPLHGIDTIVEAARLATASELAWTLIGEGQEAPRIKNKIQTEGIDSINWIPWVNYQQLIDHIAKADICLGIFGTSEKTGLVIPNKIFQIVSTGTPLVTSDTPAIREMFKTTTPGIRLIGQGSAQALLKGIKSLLNEISQDERALFKDIQLEISRKSVGSKYLQVIEQTIKQ